MKLIYVMSYRHKYMYFCQIDEVSNEVFFILNAEDWQSTRQNPTLKSQQFLMEMRNQDNTMMAQ